MKYLKVDLDFDSPRERPIPKYTQPHHIAHWNRKPGELDRIWYVIIFRLWDSGCNNSSDPYFELYTE